MTTVCYTKTLGGKYIPKNVIAADTIKCINCQEMIKSTQMSKHISNHMVQCTRFSGNNDKIISDVKKFDLRAILQDSSDTVYDISVKSYLPDELPMVEKMQKPQASEIKAEIHQGKGMNGFPLEYLTEDSDEGDGDGELDGCLAASILMASSVSPRLQIHKQLSINTAKSTFPKKRIKFYQSRNQTDFPADYEDQAHYIQKKIKPSLLGDKQNATVYQVEQIKTQRKCQEKKIDGNQIISININKNSELKFIRSKQKISTLSTSRGFLRTNNSSFLLAKNQSFATQNTDFRATPNHKLECDQCKGFYCRNCKSDIPPIFRPVPNQNGQYNVSSQEGIEFYRKYFRNQRNEEQDAYINCEPKLNA